MSFNWPVDQGADQQRKRLETRKRMIDETNAFLRWALQNPDQVRPIPRRRADEGGFREVLARPGGRAAVAHWWAKMLMKTL